jgi:predicted lipoprotein with Yx(FWY)xxD motif
MYPYATPAERPAQVAAATAENKPVKRQLILTGGTASLLILAACGSAAATGGNNSPAATPTPTSTPAPTPVATPTPTHVPATPAPATGAAVSLRSVAGLGSILVGANGNTLYYFLGDTGMTSNCSGMCAQNWPPLTTVGAPRAMSGVSQGLLGTTKRSNGTMQVTYHGHPVYFFIADTAPGMASGEGLDAFGAHWYVVSASGMTIVK